MEFFSNLPVLLWTIFFVMIGAAIPLFFILKVVKWVGGSTKKTVRSIARK